MEIIDNYKRNSAIKEYIKRLPGLLAKDYGKSKTYTPKQIRSTIERSNMNVTCACYGIAMFSTKEAFDEYHEEIGEPCDYVVMRSEVADKHFAGNTDFSVSDVESASSSFGGGTGDAGIGETGGADGGGGGGD